MDLGAWLRNIGLERYEAAFNENAIDDTVLLSLTVQDLKDLGVDIVGHRRKLLDTIAALRAQANVPPPDRLAINETSPKTKDIAERRQVIVLFSDLVESTALSARLDPEHLREVVFEYYKCVAETMRRFDGFVANYLGDGVLTYFGYPQAHEDDAERAVQAGLELITAVIGLKTHASLQTRIGIATGLVVVGDLIGSGDAQQRGIIGETPNLAARLLGSAERNMVVIDESTRRLLGDLFELEDLGPRQFKGVAGPTRAWAVLRASSVANRFEALRARGLTPLVGREEEAGLLLRRWSRAKAGEGQVVLLSGDAGLGKSRLTAALVERLAGEPHTCLRYFCSPQHTGSALHPIIGQIERAAGLAHDDTPQARLDKLDALLALTSTSPQDAVLFAEMLSLPNDGRYPVLELSSPQRRRRTLNALGLQLETLARQSPVLIIFEDAHWTDPTSLEVFSRVVDRIVTLPVLLVVTCRPEFEPPWGEPPHITAFTINRLAQREVSALIDGIVGDRLLPANIRQDIIERTDGIPLFVEEMTKAVLEAESEGEARRTAATISSPALSVPATLHASLMARLDRLGPAKEVAQIGAAIGREFSHALLSAVICDPETDLGSALDRLIQARLLFREGTSPHATYFFKHALVRDAAYGMLLREPRQILHARIAETLESQFPEIAEREPELLARHYTAADLMERAIPLWERGGMRATERSAYIEAIAHLRRGLELLATLPDTPDRNQQELALQVTLITPLMATQGWGVPEVEQASTRARALCQRVGQSAQLLPALWGLWNFYVIRAQFPVASELADQFMRLAESGQDAALRLHAHYLLGDTCFWLGDLRRALAHLDRDIDPREIGARRDHAVRFGLDPRVGCLSHAAWALWLLGYPDQAIARSRQACALARELVHPASVAWALYSASVVYQYLGEASDVEQSSQTLLVLSAEQGFSQYTALGGILQGWAAVSRGSGGTEVAQIEEHVSAWRGMGAELSSPYYLALYADACRIVGQTEQALDALARTLATLESSGERWYEAELRRLMGISLLCRSPDAPAMAESCLRQAIGVAREAQAKSLELRATISLGRVLQTMGRSDEARESLDGIYSWFTEGFDTKDLKEAKALLDELHDAEASRHL